MRDNQSHLPYFLLKGEILEDQCFSNKKLMQMQQAELQTLRQTLTEKVMAQRAPPKPLRVARRPPKPSSSSNKPTLHFSGQDGFEDAYRDFYTNQILK